MKPIAVFRFSPTEGPAHFAEWLDARGIRWTLVALDRGEVVPGDPRAFAGIGMMGGPMSVNDDLPWKAPLLDLLRDAVAADVPVIGHCLGGQLFAKALGGSVTRTAAPEIGWSEVSVVAPGTGPWFDRLAGFQTFQWHYDVFSLPPGATRVFTNTSNPNQAYTLGNTLAFSVTSR